ncbi:MAG: TetR family transcriptional regulator [Acidobacteria bacterium]|nr:TetR family transcriptional regulator [Acidobacteriota bacterium]
MAAKPQSVGAPGTAPARPSLQARKQELVRDTIWITAIDLFAEKGFEETTIDDIVAAAGSSRRTFFRHFESKRDLMVHPVANYGTSLTQAIDACPLKSSAAELFRHVVKEVAHHTVSDARTCKVMEIAARYPEAREAQLSRMAEVQDRVAAAFARRCRDEISAHVLAALTLSALSLTYRAWFAAGRKNISSAVGRVLAEFSKVVGSLDTRSA